MTLRGIVLTSSPTSAYVRQVMKAGKYQSLKVVAGEDWGIGGRSWTQVDRVFVASTTPHLLVRTRHGDGLGPHPFPHWEQVLEEVRPWAAAIIKGHTVFEVEIGNEPDRNLDTDPAGYAWHLTKSVQALRGVYGDSIKIISPALSDIGFKRWMRSPHFVEAIELCDYIGVHRYAHKSLDNDDTGHGALIRTIQTRKRLALTEKGINDANTSKRTKISRYVSFDARLGWKYYSSYDYHLCTHPINVDQANYALTLSDFA